MSKEASAQLKKMYHKATANKETHRSVTWNVAVYHEISNVPFPFRAPLRVVTPTLNVSQLIIVHRRRANRRVFDLKVYVQNVRLEIHRGS